MLTVVRAIAWFGVVVVFWSLNVRWGTDLDVDTGPPGQWERHVVGAALLALVAAMALSVSGRRGNPPSWLARGIALGGALSIALIGLYLRHDAVTGITGADLIGGPGWTWMFSGGGFVLSAAVLALALKPAETNKQKAEPAPPNEAPASSRPGRPPAKAKAKKKKRRR